MTLLIKMVKKRLHLALSTVCTSVLLIVITLWWNAQLGSIINIVSTGNALSNDKIMLAVILVFLMCVVHSLKAYISGLTCEMLTHDLRMGYARYFSKLSIVEIERLNVGEQLSKLQNEIEDVSRYISGNLFQLIDSGIIFLATFGWLLSIHAKLTLAVNLPVPVTMLYVYYASRMISHATERSQQVKGRMNQYADTLLTLFPIIRLYDATQMMLENYNKEVGEWEYQTVRVERVRARLLSLSGFLSHIPLMLMFLIGGGMVINGTLALGTLYIFLNLSGHVSGMMMNMPGFVAAFRQFLVNVNRLSPKILLDEKGQPTCI